MGLKSRRAFDYSFQQAYTNGVSRKDCIVAPFTGDNPATVVSLSAPGDAILSLGTSTTFLLSSDILPKRSTTSHLLAHPTDLHRKIIMLCYKNGALAREQVRDECANGNWHTYNGMVERTPPGCNGRVGFFFPLPEIIPQNVVGKYFFEASGLTATAADTPSPVGDIPESLHPRAILESQLLSIQSRVRHLLPNDSRLSRLVLSGGGSSNQVIRQLAAVSNNRLVVLCTDALLEDVFNTDVYVSSTEEGASFGGALLARYTWWRQFNLDAVLEDMMGAAGVGITCVAHPHEGTAMVYSDLVHIYSDCEKQVVDIWRSTSETS